MPTKPNSPDSLPKYLREGLVKQDVATLNDVIEYAQDLIEYNTEISDEEIPVDEDEEITDIEDSNKGTIIEKKVPCGKDCSGCPHGPYQYLVYRQGGDIVWDYKGKVDK